MGSQEFFKKLLLLYDLVDPTSFDPQEMYSTILTDSTLYCPTKVLGRAIGTTSPLYLYSASQRPAKPPGYCPLEFLNSFEYCPRYSFHSMDMFFLFKANYKS